MKRTALATTLGMIILLTAAVSALYGYAEDNNSGGLHSTFHYNLVRVLARAAGFSDADADTIGIACEVTDRAGAGFKDVYLAGTDRPNVNQGQQTIGLYYHFGRRGAKNATGEFTLPGSDTCQYFDPAYIAGKTFAAACPFAYLQGTGAGLAGQPGPCQVDDKGQTVPEVAEIELWAVYGRGLPRFGAPQITRGTNGTPQPVQGKSLDALGIYLHALADSYSHEACMQQCSFQGHSVAPPTCTATYWHEIAEYGPVSAQNVGVEYTRRAGEAVWQALANYRKVNGLQGAPLWNDSAAREFINKWVALDTSQEREKAADAVFTALGR